MSESVDQLGNISNSDFRQTVLPIYLVVDESSSMSGASMKAVNDGIVELFDWVNADPIVDAKVRVGIVAFNDTARVLFPLTQLSDVIQIPVCVASGSTSYAAAFRLLKSQLESEIPNLQQNFEILRPIVYFVSAGSPGNEHWRDELAKLVDPSFKFRPNIVSFGVAGAEKSVIAEVAHQVGKPGAKVFFMAEDVAVTFGAAIQEVSSRAARLRFIIASADSVWEYQNQGGSFVGGARVHVIEPRN